MANPSRKKRKRKASVVGAVLKLLFLLLLLSMLAAYIANQVALSSKKAELDTLQEQIDQQKSSIRSLKDLTQDLRTVDKNVEAILHNQVPKKQKTQEPEL